MTRVPVCKAVVTRVSANAYKLCDMRVERVSHAC